MRSIEKKITDQFGVPSQLYAPGKLNLRLKVEGRRDDGYHLLSMINVTTSLCDRLTVSLRAEPDFAITVEGNVNQIKEELLSPEKNLATLAAKRFLSGFGLNIGGKFHIEKQIPTGFGMGGGSSDAAAVLNWLKAMVGPVLVSSSICSQEELSNVTSKLAGAIGADVPYLLAGGLCHVGGIGEVVAPLSGDFVDGVEGIVIDAGVSVATKGVFDRFRSAGGKMELDRSVSGLEQKLSDGSLGDRYQALIALIENDLMPVVMSCTPELREISALMAGTPGCCFGMTGSGSGIFVLPDTIGRDSEDFKDVVRRRLSRLPVNIIPIKLAC